MLEGSHRSTLESSAGLEAAGQRANDLLKKFEINPKRFAGIRGYTDDGIARDMREVHRLEGLFESSSDHTYGRILEAVAFEHGDLSEWFGPHSEVILASRFDDYINKIDLILKTEVGEGAPPLVLGVDVTIGNYDLHKKFDQIRENIDHGRLGKVKYFSYDLPDKRIVAKPLENIPQVVIGTDLQTLTNLTGLWVNRRNKELSRHPVQVLLLEEAVLQLKTFAEYAESRGEPDLVAALEAEREKLSELLREKRNAGIPTIPDDKVFAEIKRNLSFFMTPTTVRM